MPDPQTTDPIESAWEAFWDKADLVNGTSGNVIDDMKQAFEAGYRVAMEEYSREQ